MLLLALALGLQVWALLGGRRHAALAGIVFGVLAAWVFKSTLPGSWQVDEQLFAAMCASTFR